MAQSLLFLPDISGFTQFVQNTEIEHSQHVISELLEVLIEANVERMELAEIEGDALFFYKEGEIPSLEKLLAQVEHMFTAFYSHLKLLEKNRICPCNACSTAPNLQLKIIAHCGDMQFIVVQNNRKPFGSEVIEVHRLMKNSVKSDNYFLASKELTEAIHLNDNYKTKLFQFEPGSNTYDNKQIDYLYSIIDKNELKLKPFEQSKKLQFSRDPSFTIEKEFPIAANELFEVISNFNYRSHWVKGADSFEFNSDQVNRIGSEHICVIKDKHLNFITVTKDAKPGQLVYGELTTTPPVLDRACQFYIITPLTSTSCRLTVEAFIEAKSVIKKLIIFLLVKKSFKKSSEQSLEDLSGFVASKR